MFLHDAPNDPGDDEGGDDLEDRRQQLDQEPAVPGVRKGALGLKVFFRKENGFVGYGKRGFYEHSPFLLSFASPPSPSDPCQSKGSGKRPQKSPSLTNLKIWVAINYFWEIIACLPGTKLRKAQKTAGHMGRTGQARSKKLSLKNMCEFLVPTCLDFFQSKKQIRTSFLLR